MAKIRDGSTYLSAHLSANDYYSEHESVCGRWTGRGAERLGLRGEIAAGDEAFEALRNNRHPGDGTRLTPRDRAARVCFFDFQCSAQKSVSIMAVTLGDTRLLEAHDCAAKFAFAELERFAACQANSATVRSQRLTGNVAAACFRHTASRALDPQVHTHFVVANATWDAATSSWRALTEFEMLAAIRFAGKSYQNAMARACRALGYEVEPAHDQRGSITGFEIVGVSSEVRERFSKRRREIEAGIDAFEARTGRSPTTAEIHAITLETRDAKLAEITTPEVLQRQLGELSLVERRSLSARREAALERARLGPGIGDNAREAEALAHAAAHLFERRSVVGGHEVMAEALNNALGSIDHAKLLARAARSKLVPLKEGDWLHRSFATEEGIARERWSVAFVDRTRGTRAALGVPQEGTLKSLSPEQRSAVEQVLGSRDQVVCLRGAAGVGKTTVLKALNAAFESAGLDAWHCTPTTSAAETMRREGIASATTVRDFLNNIAPSGDERMESSVIVVDEAGLASNRDGAELLQVAERWNARVLFVGDSRQHTSVEAGDFLRVLESHSGLHLVDLNAIRRQEVAAYRRAIELMASGGVREGLDRLDALGWIRENGLDYLHAAAATVLRLAEGGTRLDRVIAVTPTWAENEALTASLRAELKRRGALTAGREVMVEEPLPWTRAEKRCAANYREGLHVTFEKPRDGIAKGATLRVSRVEDGRVFVSTQRTEFKLDLKRDRFEVAKPSLLEVCLGDRLLLRSNDKSQDLRNGEVLTVAAIEGETLRSTDGRTVDLRRFRQFTHGFVVTSHKSQSRTADHVVVAAERLDAKSAYVACSRGRLSVLLHAPSKAGILKRLPAGDREAALDALNAGGARSISAGVRERGGSPHRPSRNTSSIGRAPMPAWWTRTLGRLSSWWRRVHGSIGAERNLSSIPDLHR
ncbi:MAG: relaxase domain-containing protein [Verrucomicrobia bacterium]|nr:relaxase domain-containing protein [Verrucomicrobiota bacterium]